MFLAQLDDIMEINKFIYLFISCNDQFQNQSYLFKRKCCLSVGCDKQITILSILPKISTFFVFIGSKMPRMPVTQIPHFFLIFYILYQEILFIGPLF